MTDASSGESNTPKPEPEDTETTQHPAFGHGQQAHDSNPFGTPPGMGGAPTQPQHGQFPQQPIYPPSQPQFNQPPNQGAGLGHQAYGQGYSPYGPQPSYLPPAQQQPYYVVPPSNDHAVVALILGIISFVAPLICCPFVFSFLAIGFGVSGLKKSKTLPEQHGRTNSLAGLWLGAISLLFSIALVVLVIVLGVAGELDNSSNDYEYDNSSVSMVLGLLA